MSCRDNDIFHHGKRDMDDSSIKKNIAGLRKKSGLTQTEVADRIGISRTAYRNLESGSTRMYNENIDKVAEVLDRPVEELVLGYGPHPAPRGAEEGRRGYGRKKALDEIESMVSLKEQVAYLTEQFAALKKENEILLTCVESLRETVSSKDELIALLRKESKRR